MIIEEERYIALNHLKDQVVDIFGDLIEEVYVPEEDDHDPFWQVLIDSSNIVIKFKNGNFVKFTSSEWLTITKVNRDEVVG